MNEPIRNKACARVLSRKSFHRFIGGPMRLSLVMVMVAAVLLMISQLDGAHALEKSSVFKGSDLVGMHVEERGGKRLGEIKDLVVDPTDGGIDYVVLDYGGLLGVGHKYFAVPWKALTFTG